MRKSLEQICREWLYPKGGVPFEVNDDSDILDLLRALARRGWDVDLSYRVESKAWRASAVQRDDEIILQWLEGRHRDPRRAVALLVAEIAKEKTNGNKV